MKTRRALQPDGATAGGASATPALTILIVEDESNLRSMLSIVFRREGHRVVEFRDGAELVAAVAREPGPDWKQSGHYLVVIDLRMPGLDGLSALASMRDLGQSPPFVLITAFPEPRIRSVATLLGALAVLEKPFDFEELRAIIRTFARGPRA